MNITFTGEMQLAGWNDSHTGGAKITLWLPESSDLDIFRGLTARKGNIAGQRFMVAMVEIDDQEQPVPAVEKSVKGAELAKLAGMWCANGHFADWLQTDHPDTWVPVWAAGCLSGRDQTGCCAECIRVICGVVSRAELDHNETAGMRFHTLIRIPFMAYLEEVQ